MQTKLKQLTQMKNKEISILIPAYNAEDFINETILKIVNRMTELQISNYEVIIVENGSTDQTKEIVEKLAKENIKLIAYSQPKADLGNAMKKAIEESNGAFSIYLPADLSYSLDFINESLKLKETFDVIYGSKMLKDSNVNIRKSRKFLSNSFSFLVKMHFRFKVKDTQGVKAFKTNLFKKYLSIFPNGFLWDLGFVYVAKKKEYKWIEIPCNVVDLHTSSSVRIIRTTLRMLFGLKKFRLKTWYTKFPK